MFVRSKEPNGPTTHRSAPFANVLKFAVVHSSSAGVSHRAFAVASDPNHQTRTDSLRHGRQADES